MTYFSYHTCALAAAMLLACAAAGAAGPRFSTSFEAGEPVPAALQEDGLRLSLGSGPERPYAAKPKAGYSGARALRYSSDGAGGRIALFAVDIVIGADTTLSWKVLPEIV